MVIPSELDHLVIVSTAELSDWNDALELLTPIVDLRKSVVMHLRPYPDRDTTLGDQFMELVHSDDGPRELWSTRRPLGVKFTVVGSAIVKSLDGLYARGKSRNVEGSFGRPFRAVTRFDRFQAGVDHSRFIGIAEAKLPPSRRKPITSKVVKAWLKHLPDGVIPYSAKERKKLLARKELVEHAAMFEKK